MSKRFSHRNGETQPPSSDQVGLYWIKGELIIREKMWPYSHRQRVELGREMQDMLPYEISNGLICMQDDVYVPVEWATAKTRFWGPVILTAPWMEE